MSSVNVKTELKTYYDIIKDGVIYPTRDSWTIPKEGTEVWCTGWPRGQTIKPYGDGCHVVVGITVYHCNEFMDILIRWKTEGEKWGIDSVTMKREQQINGTWTEVEIE